MDDTIKDKAKFHFNKDDGSLNIIFLDKELTFLQRLIYLFNPKKRKRNFVVSSQDVDLLVRIAIKSKLTKQKRK